MKKSKFQKAIYNEKNRLLDMGYSYSTLRSWWMGTRLPGFETACILAKLLGMEIKDVPYYQVIRKH